jgi:ubiquinone/menaquinone biosynthesis C-methylase UbiE
MTQKQTRIQKQEKLTIEKVDQAYASPSWWYDLRGLFILTFAYNSNLIQQIRFFNRNIKSKHLEAAIGSGSLFNLILKWRAIRGGEQVSITAFDYAEKMLQAAQKRFSKQKHVKVVRGDIGKLQFASQSFESVNIANSFHCFPDVGTALSESYRVLQPGGTLAMNVLLYPKGNGWLQKLATKINVWGAKKGILHTPYHAETIISALHEKGFQILEQVVLGNCFNVIALKPLVQLSDINLRQDRRIPFETMASLHSKGVQILDISSGGIGATCEEHLDINQIFELNLQSSQLQTQKLRVKAVWHNENRYGFQIVEPDANWSEDISKISKESELQSLEN